MRDSWIGWSATGVGAMLLAAATGCVDAGPMEVRTAEADEGLAASMAGGADVVRPLEQHSRGVLAPVGLCAGGVAMHADGTGLASHTGRFEISMDWCIDPSTGAIADGDATVVAANGDEISMAFTGQATSATELIFYVVIDGGTGRFEGASGAIDTMGTLGAGGSWSASGVGWIRY